MKKISATVICLAWISIPALFYSCKPNEDKSKNADTVRIEAGIISGIKSKADDVVAFKGIPFAAPPIGELRWKAPQPVQPWEGVKKCIAFGPSPMQETMAPFGPYTSEFLVPEKPVSEDCLYLNVWTSAGKGDKKPVFVWIYGGGFSRGSSSLPIYDGEAMAKKGVIFVSLNYRVGIFGFLAHPDLSKESPDKASGNYGLLDQIAALKWVKKNIAAFGGDPDNVTIGGQSAGSMSVSSLVASPVAKGLFNKAIAESGSLLVTNQVLKINSLAIAEQDGLKLAQGIKTSSLAQLKAVPADKLVKVQGLYGPIIDGYVLPEPIGQIFAEGKQNNVPVLTGWNADDVLFVNYEKKEAFIKQARLQYGNSADEFLKYYTANTEEEAARSQEKLNRDIFFATSGYKWGNIQSTQGRSPVFIYYFKRRLPGTADLIKYGSFHMAEIPYVMDNLQFLQRPWGSDDHKLANLMSTYWINFIKNGDPNGKSLPLWPKFDLKSKQAMVFDAVSSHGELPDWAELNFMMNKLDK